MIKYTPRLPTKNVNVTATSPIKDLAVLLGGLLVLLFALYLALGLFAEWAAGHISPRFEEKLAAPFLKMVNLDEERTAPETTLQRLADEFDQQCMDLPYTFNLHIQSSAMINAIALPGGHIVVFQGLIDKVESLNELAFVVAHEMGHYANRDHLKGLGRTLVFMSLSTLLFGPDSRVSTLLGRWLHITELGFSRRQETRADKFAMDALACRYGHVSGAGTLFNRMAPDQDPGFRGHYFSTHPQKEKRLADIEAYRLRKGYTKGELNPLPDSLGLHSDIEKTEQRTH